jgi:hypothetical protein
MREDEDENEEQQNKKNPRITGRTWINASYSVTVILPRELAQKHGLIEPCTVVFEDSPRGILIRRLEF